MKELVKFPVTRVMLPDTLGILNPETVTRYLDWMKNAFPDVNYDFHGHNDYGVSVANCLAAVKANVNGVHVTVNGLGERTGNPPLAEVIAVIHDMSERKTHVTEKYLDHISRVVQSISGKRVAANSPIVGNDVFTQTCGVHADGDKKGNLYANPLLPERFGRKRQYALGKLSGKASIDKNLEELGLELDSETRNKVLQEVIRLGDKKKKISQADLSFIIADVLKSGDIIKHIEFIDYDIITSSTKLPEAKIKIRVGKEELSARAKGDGGYDALMKAVRKALKVKNMKPPRLMDYEVCIPPGGKTDALVETKITWDNGPNAPIVTIGVDSDQIVAAIQATEKMLNIVFGKR